MNNTASTSTIQTAPFKKGLVLYGLMTLYFVILMTACLPPKKEKMSKEENTLVFNKETTIIGIYKKCILSKKKEAPHQGHYKIVLDDNTEVVLLPPYEQEAKRSAEEVEQYEGKKVKVKGIIEEETYLEEPSLDYESLTVDVPCFVSITSIQLAK